MTSENDTTNVTEVLRALVDHGATLSREPSQRSLMDDAIFCGSEEMVTELGRLMDGNDHLAGVVVGSFSDYVSHHTVSSLLLLGQYNALNEGLEKHATAAHVQIALPEILETLARWGFTDLFKRIVSLMVEGGWINGGMNRFKKILMPYLLLAAERPIPNVEMIKLIVEHFKADVNVQFQSNMVVKPRLPFQSEIRLGRAYKPGESALHYLAKEVSGGTPRRFDISFSMVQIQSCNVPMAALHCPMHKNSFTPLSLATYDIELFRLLLDNGASLETCTNRTMFVCLDYVNLDVLSFLLERGINCNTTTLQKEDTMPGFNEKYTRDRATELIQYLLGQGADPFRTCCDETTIIHQIFQHGGIIQPFLEIPDLDVERRHAQGRPLLLTASNCSVGTTSFAMRWSLLEPAPKYIKPANYSEGDTTRPTTLYNQGADITAVDDAGNNTLYYLVAREFTLPATREQYRHTVSSFVRKALELLYQAHKEGQTPLDIVREGEGQWEQWALEGIRDAGVEVNQATI
ncbi:hypothetical protein BBP40_010996 [Aspergillus hancockii]|nr:hypothetical protein BBP40_010996 [Aspergillus hancockii]